jgi:large subunit ribosomal protein L18
MLNPKLRRARRIKSARKKLVGTPDTPRLAFTRTTRYLYAQVIDDTTGKSIANYTTKVKKESSGGEVFKDMKSRKNKAAAVRFGGFVGSKLLEKGVRKIVFDRRGRRYHGVVKEFADALRKAGIGF